MNNSGNDDHQKRKTGRASNEHRLNVAYARAQLAEAAAAEAREKEKKMSKQAAFWKAEALQERKTAAHVDAYAYALYRKLNNLDCEVHNLTRERLIKALRGLGSDQPEERASAALMIEKQRLMLGKPWNELIVGGARTNDTHDDQSKKTNKPTDRGDGYFDLDMYFEDYERRDP